MEIRKSTFGDIDEVLRIFQIAREYMAAHGNVTQWDDGYPGEEVLKDDMMNENHYVIMDHGMIVGTFSFIIGDEPTYHVINHGTWHHNKAYGTIHRVASRGVVKGVARTCFDFCTNLIDYIRIDTHKDNLSMQAAIEKYGFQKCGEIYVRDGSKRIAYDYDRGQVS